MPTDVSLVIPVLNEEESLPSLFDSIDNALKGSSYEVVIVDDGSTDRTLDVLRERLKRDDRLRVASFARNFGQTSALAAGIDLAQGKTIVCLDADGQNDPADIPLMLKEMDKGYDVVSGWRFDRQDPFISRRLPSKIANAIISFVTGVHIHDYGCTLKAYRRDVLKDLRLYGEMHRFIPAWCAWRGAKVAEVKVRHHPRRLGKSKYGIMRTFKVILDLVTAKFFSSYLTKPSYFFGGVGLLLFLCCFLAGLFPIYDKFVLNHYGHLRVPFLIFSAFLGILAAQFIVLGLLAEILIRIYYESQNKRPYQVKEVLGVPAAPR